MIGAMRREGWKVDFTAFSMFTFLIQKKIISGKGKNDSFKERPVGGWGGRGKAMSNQQAFALSSVAEKL